MIAEVTARGLFKKYDTYKVGTFLTRRIAKPILNDIDFQLRRGEVVGVVGESGSGKTTLGRMLAQMTPLSEGSIDYLKSDGQPYDLSDKSGFRSEVQLILQNIDSALNPGCTVREVLKEAIRIGSTDDGLISLLRRVELDEAILEKYPHELSGGQKRRVGVARVVAIQPSVLIADEPLAGLDAVVSLKVLGTLLRLQAELGFSMVFITHDLRVARKICDRVYVFLEGRVVESGPVELLSDSARHPYVRQLIESSYMKPAGTARSLNEFGMEVEGAGTRSESGCRFRPRCQVYGLLDDRNQCLSSSPELGPTDENWKVACHHPYETGARNASTE